MSNFYLIIIATSIVSLVSFVGVLILFLKEKILDRTLLFFVAFSGGALMGGAFLHLLPEAIEKTDKTFEIFLYLILGFCIFFILEQFIKWHHHHSTQHPEIMPFSYLILVSDILHNFIDGLIIAGAFLVSVPAGIVTTLAVIFHEIPQEIGDFAVLIYGGFKKTKALLLNFASALVAIFGGIVGFFLFSKMGGAITIILPITAGGFLYIAASDLIPQIKEEKNTGKSAIYFLIFLTGIFFMVLIKILYE
ncbi:ZIP family metal transporter [Patescibacteria group bacterium]